MAHRPSSRFLVVIGLVVFFLLFIVYFRQEPPLSPEARAPGHVGEKIPNVVISNEMLDGDVVMPKLGNAKCTVGLEIDKYPSCFSNRAELGRASWKLLHTMMARYPDEPSKEQQETLRSFIYLFARLYPCGECATHLRTHLKKYPPQVSSRSSAAVWACHVHNEVNKALQKEIFDCSKIGDFYDCGCAGDDGDDDESKVGLPGKKHKPSENDLEIEPGEGGEVSQKEKGKLSQDGRGFSKDPFHRVEITSEPQTNGG